MQGHRQELRLEHTEGLNRCQVGRPLHNDPVTLVQEDLPCQIQALLGACCDQDLLWTDLEALFCISLGDVTLSKEDGPR